MNKNLFCLALLLFTLPALYGFGGREKAKENGETKTAAEPESKTGPNMVFVARRPPADAVLPEIEISGAVSLIGSGPGKKFVITNSSGQWHTEAAEQDKLRDMQQFFVTVRAKTYTTVVSNGKLKIATRYLRDITVLSHSNK